jgi:hypothetical protein
VGSGRDSCGRGRGHGGHADRELEEGERADKWGPPDSGSGTRMREGTYRQAGPRRQIEREGEGVRVRELPLTGGLHQSDDAGGSAELGRFWLARPNWGFPFSKNF